MKPEKSQTIEQVQRKDTDNVTFATILCCKSFLQNYFLKRSAATFEAQISAPQGHASR
jgi:hypothetical protein